MPDNGKSRNVKETIKSVALVVLFLLTILLLYVYWKDINPNSFTFNDLKNQENQKPVILIEDILYPDAFEISYGDESYGTAFHNTKELWYEEEEKADFVTALKGFLNTKDLFTEEITKEQYDKVMEQESIKAVFDSDLPVSFILKTYDINIPKTLSQQDMVSEIGFSFASMESLFLRNTEQDKYIRIVRAQENIDDYGFSDVYLKADHYTESAYPLSVLLGEEGYNTLVPLPLRLTHNLFTYTNERNQGGEEFERALAKTFFGDIFDFTRIIKEAQGTVTYMYGYGQRVLVSESKGAFYYTNQEAKESISDYYDSLDKALLFISKHMGTEDAQGVTRDLKLCDVKLQKNDLGQRGITYTFCLIDKGPVKYKTGEALSVTVKGDKISDYKRDFYLTYKEQSEILSLGDYTAVNVLAKNYEDMLHKLKEEGFFEEGEKLYFNGLLDLLTRITIGDVRFDKNNEGIGKIETCFIFSFSKEGERIDMYYSIKDALFMGYSIR